MPQRQKTIKSSISFEGIGLHSGEKIRVIVRPAPTGHGIVFRRIDCDPVVVIPASYHFIHSTTLCTTLSSSGKSIATVEHFLSAVSGVGLDNLLVDVEGPELPIMDGSAAPFVFLLNAAGVQTQPASKKMLLITDKVEVTDGNKYCGIEPCDHFSVSLSINYNQTVVDQTVQQASYHQSTDCYARSVSRARTFGFIKDVKKMMALELIKGASTKNAIVVGDHEVVNDSGLRSGDEFVKHKILDAIGDLALVGSPISGHYYGYCSGHRLNKLLIDKIISTRSYEWVL
ncbi:MAG: UDP-3-O-acyl-N-acetylglucosamine deacetylase [Pseudomonadota bacterium]|nr:UDP-3-O-acyl-N-acetylglucosamine deacetylase [Pseudomonadota bacterium]